MIWENSFRLPSNATQLQLKFARGLGAIQKVASQFYSKDHRRIERLASGRFEIVTHGNRILRIGLPDPAPDRVLVSIEHCGERMYLESARILAKAPTATAVDGIAVVADEPSQRDLRVDVHQEFKSRHDLIIAEAPGLLRDHKLAWYHLDHDTSVDVVAAVAGSTMSAVDAQQMQASNCAFAEWLRLRTLSRGAHALCGSPVLPAPANYQRSAVQAMETICAAFEKAMGASVKPSTVGESFQKFAAGELQLGPATSTDGVPNSAYFFSFVELAWMILEMPARTETVQTHLPTTKARSFWAACIPSLVRAARAYWICYWPGAGASAPRYDDYTHLNRRSISGSSAIHTATDAYADSDLLATWLDRYERLCATAFPADVAELCRQAACETKTVHRTCC